MEPELELKKEILEKEESELKTFLPTKPVQVPEALQVMERNWYAEHGDPFMT